MTVQAINAGGSPLHGGGAWIETSAIDNSAARRYRSPLHGGGAWIETSQRSRLLRDDDVRPSMVGGRGLKLGGPRTSAGSSRSPLHGGGAWIETVTSATTATGSAGVRPSMVGGRGLKRLTDVCYPSNGRVRPSMVGGRGLKLPPLFSIVKRVEFAPPWWGGVD